jgi:hypothetical protein
VIGGVNLWPHLLHVASGHGLPANAKVPKKGPIA